MNNPINHPSLKETQMSQVKNITDNFASTKNYSNQFNSVRSKGEKNLIKFTSDNSESYNQPFTLTKLQNSISKSATQPPTPLR